MQDGRSARGRGKEHVWETARSWDGERTTRHLCRAKNKEWTMGEIGDRDTNAVGAALRIPKKSKT